MGNVRHVNIKPPLTFLVANVVFTSLASINLNIKPPFI